VQGSPSRTGVPKRDPTIPAATLRKQVAWNGHLEDRA